MIWSLTLLLGWCVVTQARTMHENATMSGLVFANLTDDKEPQWNDQEIPPLRGGWRYKHASVVVANPENAEDQTIVVFGGQTDAVSPTDSVILLTFGKHHTTKWREGPKMNEKRNGHDVVVCNGWVYAIGGFVMGVDEGKSYSDAIERIRVADLLESSLESNRKNWTTLDVRLSSQRNEFTAAVVRNRYIVVAGGLGVVNNSVDSLSTVEIIDTESKGGPVVIQGPSLNEARYSHGTAVIGNRVYLVGGGGRNGELESVEYLEFRTEKSCNEDITFLSSWTMDKNLSLVESRKSHAVLNLGLNLVVAGGYTGFSLLKSVKVLDTKGRVVWHLPNMTIKRDGCSMVATANGIVVVGGYGHDSCEILPLLIKKKAQKLHFKMRYKPSLLP